MADAIVGWQRVADPGACDFCASVDGAFVKSGAALPLHDGCGCGLEPLTELPSRNAQARQLIERGREITNPGAVQRNTVLTEADARAVANYTGSHQSFLMNELLRTGEIKATSSPRVADQMRGYIDDLDRAMANTGPIGATTTAYRGVRVGPADLGLPVGELEGAIFTDLGFVSGSTRAEWAATFTESDGGLLATSGASGQSTVFDLTITPGVKAIAGVGDAHEAEILLERGCRFVIETAEREGNRWKIKATVLPPE